MLPNLKLLVLCRITNSFKASCLQRSGVRHLCDDNSEWKLLRRDFIFGGWGVWGHKCDGWETIRDKGIRIQQ